MAKKIDRDAVLSSVKKDLEWAETYYTDTIEPLLIERYEIYKADKRRYKRLYPKLSEKNSLRSFDMWSVVEWLIPSLLKAFFGSDTILSVNGMGPEDVHRAELFEKWLQWQNTVKNKGYRIFKGWFQNALISNLGILKCWWHRDEEEQVKDEVLSSEQLSMLESSSEVTILSVTPGPYVTFESWNVKWKETKLLRNHPVIETLRPCDFRFTPDGRVLGDCTLQAHRKVVTLDHLRREAKKGLYEKDMIEDLAESATDSWQPSQLEVLLDDAAEDSAGRMEGERSPKRRFTLYECFTKYDLDDDGELEDVIVTICADRLLRVVENPYGRTPFFDLVPFQEDNKVWSDIGLAEIVGDIQDANTAFFRQMVVSLANANESRGIVNTDFVDIDDLISDSMYVRANGQAQSWFLPLTTSGINPQTFNLYETFRGALEQWTPMTRYNQGTDANTLNKMLALDTPIPLTDGSVKLNRDIIAGDMVIGSNGRGTKVLKAHPIQLPKRAFEIEVQTGDVIKAGGEHRWSVMVRDRSGRISSEWEKMSTEKIYDLMLNGCKVYIPRVERPDFTEKDFPVDPYVLGAWLGDGHLHTNRFTTQDPEIVSSFEKWSRLFYKGGVEECVCQNGGRATTYQLVNTPFRRMLKDMGLMRDSRYEDMKENVKHIPMGYLQGSFEQRVALLRGLMDTDGCIDKKGNAIFCNSEPALVESFVRLIDSFGCRSSVYWRALHDPKFKNPKPHAHVLFSVPFCPVSLPAKFSRWRTNKKYWEKQRIVSIREIPLEPMRCLTVEADDELYCCGRKMTLTSNTASGISMIMSASQQRQDEIIANFAETGVSDLIRFEIQLNQRYMDQPTHFRLGNDYLEITPDDISGEFDLAVNGTTGIADRTAKNQALTGYLREMYPAAEARGLAGPDQFVKAGRRLLKLNGLEDGDEYLIMPAPAGMPSMGMGGMGTGGSEVGGGAVPDSTGMPGGLPGGGGAPGIGAPAVPVLPGGGVGASL